MYINFNRININFSGLTEKFLNPLTDQQKRIITIASIAFNFILMGYILYQSNRLSKLTRIIDEEKLNTQSPKNSKQEVEEVQLNEDKIEEIQLNNDKVEEVKDRIEEIQSSDNLEIHSIPPIPHITVNAPTQFYAFQSMRCTDKIFNEVLKHIEKNMDLKLEKTAVNPGPGTRVIVFDFWGRIGGKVTKPPIYDPQTSFIHVIISPASNSNIKSIKDCDWSVDKNGNQTIINLVYDSKINFLSTDDLRDLKTALI